MSRKPQPCLRKPVLLLGLQGLDGLCYLEAEPLPGTKGKFLHPSSALKGPDSFRDEGSNALWVSVVAWGKGRKSK